MTAPLPDWDKLTFAYSPTDWMYQSYADSDRPTVWDAGEFVPFQKVPVSPAAAFMSYGLGIFEGLKAQRCQDGRVLLFRADRNAERFRRSAERLLLAPFPEDRFVSVCQEIVRRNLRFVPPHDKGSFYLRPIEVGVQERLGLGPATQFLALFYGSPVGGYFGSGAAPKGVRLRVLEQGRVAPGGTGAAKAMANYAGGIQIAYLWKQRGFDDVLYTDARHQRFVTETSGSNVFVKLRDGRLVTHPVDDQILDGNTRDSTITIARQELDIPVEERPISIEEVVADGEEVFASGTAWTLLPIRELVWRDETYRFPATAMRDRLFERLRGIQTGQREDPYGWTTAV